MERMPIRIDFLYYEDGGDVDPDLIDCLLHCAAIRRTQRSRRRADDKRVLVPAVEPPF